MLDFKDASVIESDRESNLDERFLHLGEPLLVEPPDLQVGQPRAGLQLVVFVVLQHLGHGHLVVQVSRIKG